MKQALKFFLKNGEASVMQQETSLSGAVVISASVTYHGTEYPITSLGNKAFYDCRDLISIDLPSSITSLGSSCFYGCSNLYSVTCHWESFDGINVSADNTFNDIFAFATLYVPKGTISLYQNTEPWMSSFKYIEEMEA